MGFFYFSNFANSLKVFFLRQYQRKIEKTLKKGNAYDKFTRIIKHQRRRFQQL